MLDYGTQNTLKKIQLLAHAANISIDEVKSLSILTECILAGTGSNRTILLSSNDTELQL